MALGPCGQRLLELAGAAPDVPPLRARETGYAIPSHFVPIRSRRGYGLFDLWY